MEKRHNNLNSQSRKNKHSPEGRKPIILLNTMTKLMEKIINLRLIQYLEKNNILFKEQNYFCPSRQLFMIKIEI